eukprot:TRINITY_DN3280_c0_g1_i1.p1 TRINITY_DN3280_c0_g1~~TRINITY_DN3280_c0_g1_i1.p1  ORF type:complete len:393 (+),score=99.87 TRINITY_DN3280_c0_g1_i1:18-1196(+)
MRISIVGVLVVVGCVVSSLALNEVESYDYIWGTQTIGVLYSFTQDNKLVETAKVIESMGSNIIKIIIGSGMTNSYKLPAQSFSSLTDQAKNSQPLAQVLAMPFAHNFLWTYTFTGPNWKDGFTSEEQQIEYKEIYDFTAHLLSAYNNTGKSFYLGHWEGDWTLLGGYDRTKDPSPVTIQGMIDWLNARQRAVEDAKRNHPHHNVFVWQYTEANLVRKALTGKPTLANSVLPYVNVDYISYSSYDSLDATKVDQQLPESLNYLKSKLRAKTGVPGTRVFLGEYGYAQSRVGGSAQKQDELSRKAAKIAMQWGADFVLFWETYCNEVSEGKHVGWWLVNDENQKLPLYYSMQSFNSQARTFVAEFLNKNKRVPTRAEFLNFTLPLLDKSVAEII